MIFAGGVLGTIYVIGNILLVPKLGTAVLFAFAIAGQLLAALVIDQYGLLGLAVRELSLGASPVSQWFSTRRGHGAGALTRRGGLLFSARAPSTPTLAAPNSSASQQPRPWRGKAPTGRAAILARRPSWPGFGFGLYARISAQ